MGRVAISAEPLWGAFCLRRRQGFAVHELQLLVFYREMSGVLRSRHVNCCSVRAVSPSSVCCNSREWDGMGDSYGRHLVLA